MTEAPTAERFYTASTTVVVEYPVYLTPKRGVPTRISRYRAINSLGLPSARETLFKEADREERWAKKNDLSGKERAAAARRHLAACLRVAADILSKIEKQILEEDPGLLE